MRIGLPGYTPEEPHGGPATKHYGSHTSSILLDRYGIAYVCRHPEILFTGTIGPLSGLARIVCRGYVDLGYRDRNLTIWKSERGQTKQTDDVLRRAAEAYRILATIYAP